MGTYREFPEKYPDWESSIQSYKHLDLVRKILPSLSFELGLSHDKRTCTAGYRQVLNWIAEAEGIDLNGVVTL